MARRKLKIKCPVCRQPVESTGADFPFCSERCRLIDLGKWASGHYVISSPLLDASDEAEPLRPPGSNDEE